MFRSREPLDGARMGPLQWPTMTAPTKQTPGLIERTKSQALTRNRRRLADLVTLIRRRMTDVVEGFYDIGEALREVLDKKLYAAEGHKSFEAFLKAGAMMSGRQARKLIAVVRKVPRERALALGQERAYALIAYTDATPEDDSPAQLVDDGVKIGGRPAAEASVRDIKLATRAANAKAQAGRPKTDAARAKEKADAALVKALRALLREAGLGGAAVTLGRADVRITLPRAAAERATR